MLKNIGKRKIAYSLNNNDLLYFWLKKIFHAESQEEIFLFDTFTFQQLFTIESQWVMPFSGQLHMIMQS